MRLVAAEDEVPEGVAVHVGEEVAHHRVAAEVARAGVPHGDHAGLAEVVDVVFEALADLEADFSDEALESAGEFLGEERLPS